MTIKASAILAVAALAISSQLALAQGRVGVTAIDIPAGTDTRLSVPQVNEVVGEFEVTATNASQSQITLGNAGFSAGQFPLNSQLKALYYVRFKDGNLAGEWYNIDGQSGDALTLSVENTGVDASAELGNASIGDTAIVLKHWTIAELFPDGQEGLSFTASPSPFTPTFRLFLPRDSDGIGTSVPTTREVFYFDGEWLSPPSTVADDFVVAPQGTLIVRNPNPVSTGQPDDPAGVTVADESTGSLVYFPVGGVLNAPIVEKVAVENVTNDTVTGAGNIFPVSLADSGLGTVIENSPNQFIIGDQVFIAPTPTAGAGFDVPAVDTFFRLGGDFLAPPNIPSNDVMIQPGEVVIIRKEAGAADSSDDWQVR